VVNQRQNKESPQSAVNKGKGVCIAVYRNPSHSYTECHLPYGITQCYLPPDTSEHISPSPQPDRPVLDLLYATGDRVD